MMSLQPVQFGKYLLLDRIAVGGMAELYRAKITGVEGFEKVLAIKKILPHLTSEEELIGSFIDEAKLAAFLQHQNIVQIYDFGSMEGMYFIAMEYLLGKDLRQIIPRSKEKDIPLTLDNSLYIISQICAGLDYAHKLKDFNGKELNIIHRDVGPQNIFVTYEGHVKVIDFGIAKAAIQGTTTEAGSIKGKVAYMSPEQALGKNIDHRSDIFSIGIMLYETVTGRRMFDGDTFKAFAKVRRAEFEPAEKVKPGLHPNLYAILNRALAKEPDDRYHGADEMLGDINDLIADLSLPSSDWNISQYMKQLYEGEAEKEEAAMRDAMREGTMFEDDVKADGQEEPGGPDEGIVYKETVSLGTDELPLKKKRHISLYSSMVLLLLLIGAAVAYYLELYPAWKPVPGKIHDRKPPTAAPVLPMQPVFSPDILKRAEEGNRMVKEGHFLEASTIFEKIIAESPAMEDNIRKSYSLALQGQASVLIGKDPDRAKTFLLKAGSLDPANAQGQYLLGRLYAAQGDPVSAESLYERAIELDSELTNAYFNLGYIYSKNKDYNKAQKMYERVVELSPDFIDEALCNLAFVQAKLGKQDAAIESAQRAADINPENKQARKILKKLKREK